MSSYTARELAQRLDLTPSIITRCLQAYEKAAHLTLPRDPLSGRIYQLDPPTFELMVELIQQCQQHQTPLISGVRFATQLIMQQRLTVSYVALDPATQTPPARTLEDLTNAELRQVLLDMISRLGHLTEQLARVIPPPRVTPAPVMPAPAQRPD